jgi:hypothetical protein
MKKIRKRKKLRKVKLRDKTLEREADPTTFVAALKTLVMPANTRTQSRSTLIGIASMIPAHPEQND